MVEARRVVGGEVTENDGVEWDDLHSFVFDVHDVRPVGHQV